MKKALTFLVLVMALFALSVMPMVLADGDDTDGPIIITTGNHVPVIYVDSTQRTWYPNDQTFHTATAYGTPGVNLYGDSGFTVPERGNYVFTGETVTYYVIVEDEDGQADIDTVRVLKDGIGAGSCSEIPMPALPWLDGAVLAQYGGLTYSDATMNTYRCRVIIQSSWSGASEFEVEATDDHAHVVTSTWSDLLNVNPALSLTLTGSVDFGTVTPGTTATSNSVYLNSVGSDGVVMDTYIASDDYFTDPSNPGAICGVANGIPYDAFDYYATKGSFNSGANNNAFPGLSVATTSTCIADPDEYTQMPSHSGYVQDMCRIINHDRGASFLSQGQSMSLTFQLDVPTPCDGSFTDGSFHFAGRVV